MRNFSNNWYVLYTRVNHEKKTTGFLREREIDYYLPLVKKIRIWHDRRKCISAPLFPSYVFVYLANVQQYYDALSADGALYFVRSGGAIAAVDRSVIDGIRMLVENGMDIKIANNWLPGKPVTGLCGEIVSYDGKEKIQIRLQLLQRSLLVAFTPEYLVEAIC
jgi:transcriptional antiterminator RfaH